MLPRSERTIACRRCERQRPCKRRQPKKSHEKYLVRTKAITPASNDTAGRAHTLQVLDENELPGFPDCFSSKILAQKSDTLVLQVQRKFCTVEQLRKDLLERHGRRSTMCRPTKPLEEHSGSKLQPNGEQV